MKKLVGCYMIDISPSCHQMKEYVFETSFELGYRVVQNSVENRCISSFYTVKTHEISLFWYQKLPENVAKN